MTFPDRVRLSNLNTVADMSISVDDVPTVRARAVDGATFVLTVPDKIPAIWGDAGGVLWAKG